MAENDRIHGFDTLRGFALLLGILIHAVIPYLSPALQIWPALDTDPHVGYTVLVVVIHAFRLQVFFLLAGFFSSLLIEKRGVRGFIRNRFQRIVIPFLVSLVVLVPVMQAIMIVGYSMRENAGYVEIGSLIMDTRVYQTSLGEFFQSGKFLTEIFLYHLWFLYYLILIYGCVLLFRWSVMGTQLATKLGLFSRGVLSHRLVLLWLTLGATVCMWPMVLWQVDTPYSIIPNPVLVCYYLLFFVVGMVLYHNQDILNTIKKKSLRYLLFGLLVLPIALFFQSFGPNPTGIPAREQWKILALLSYSVFTWSAVLGLTGWFAEQFVSPNRITRRISETAYWQYLVHLPVMFGFQLYLVTIDLGSVAEILIQLVAVSLFLYYSYVWVVGRTFIGQFLNGRRIQDLDF